MPCVGTPSGWSSMSLVTSARSQFRFTSEENADRSPVFSAAACWESRQTSSDVVVVKGSLNRKATLNRALPALPPLPGWVGVDAPDTGCRYWLLAAFHSPDAEATRSVDRPRVSKASLGTKTVTWRRVRSALAHVPRALIGIPVAASVTSTV